MIALAASGAQHFPSHSVGWALLTFVLGVVVGTASTFVVKGPATRLRVQAGLPAQSTGRIVRAALPVVCVSAALAALIVYFVF